MSRGAESCIRKPAPFSSRLCKKNGCPTRGYEAGSLMRSGTPRKAPGSASKRCAGFRHRCRRDLPTSFANGALSGASDTSRRRRVFARGEGASCASVASSSVGGSFAAMFRLGCASRRVADGPRGSVRRGFARAAEGDRQSRQSTPSVYDGVLGGCKNDIFS